MRKKYEGYFTVEAALVLPVVLGFILFVVYLGIFQYDRCALEQKLNLITLLALSADVQSNEEKVERAQKLASEADDRFLAWELQEVSFSISRGKMVNVFHGTVRFPFRFLFDESMDNLWIIQAKAEGNSLKPVSFVRNYKKIEGGLSNGN